MNGACEQCKAGHYRQSKEVVNGIVTATTTDATKCVICPAGWTSEEGSTKCQWCEAGSYSDEEGKGCSPCTKGQYRKARMKPSSCWHCIAGQYQTEEGQASW